MIFRWKIYFIFPVEVLYFLLQRYIKPCTNCIMIWILQSFLFSISLLEGKKKIKSDQFLKDTTLKDTYAFQHVLLKWRCLPKELRWVSKSADIYDKVSIFSFVKGTEIHIVLVLTVTGLDCTVDFGLCWCCLDSILFLLRKCLKGCWLLYMISVSPAPIRWVEELHIIWWVDCFTRPWVEVVITSGSGMNWFDCSSIHTAVSLLTVISFHVSLMLFSGGILWLKSPLVIWLNMVCGWFIQALSF